MFPTHLTATQDVQHVAGQIASGSTTTGAALTSATSAVLATA
ncbi:putative P4-specific DNA primase domain protein [Shigella flexneri 1235-66]|nr:putative P4-specific DNA primase domain protein [Shigella flexneri 1235-66]